MKIKITHDAVFKFHSKSLPFKHEDFVSSDMIFHSHGHEYFYPVGGKVVSVWEDPEQPVQEPKMCVRIKSL
jgi:hypothetical protein